jgi:hypothetical protein
MGRYEERQRGQDARAGKKRKGRQFLQLFTNVKRSTAYHGLSLKARALLFELIDRYNGINNGMIGLGVREAKHELRISHGSVINAMRELDDAGLARPTKLGSRLGKKATEWRLTFLRCNKTHEPAVTVWEQRRPHSEVSHESTKGQPEEHRVSVRSATKAQTPNSSMNGPTMRSATEAHIDIYQGGRGAAELTPEGKLLAASLSKTESNQRPSSSGGLFAKPKTTSKSKKGVA